MIKPLNDVIRKQFNSAAIDYEHITNLYAKSRRFAILKHWAKGSCLEIGAGTGEFAKLLEKDHRVIATDIAENMVRIAKAKGLIAIVADAEKLPFKNRTFDTIIASEVIYYLDNPEKFLKEAYRILKPHGLLLLTSTSNSAKYIVFFRTLLRKLGLQTMYFDDGVSDFITGIKLRLLLQKNKFNIEEERKIIFLPFHIFHLFNMFIEKTPLKIFCAFLIVKARKG